MKLSLSIQSSQIIDGYNNWLESILMGIPKKRACYFDRVSYLIKRGEIEGIEVIIPSKIDDKGLYAIKDACQKRKIPVLSIHQPILQIFKIDFKSIKFLFHAAEILSAKVIVVHIFALGKNILSVEFMKKLKKLKNKYKIHIGLENSSKNILTGGLLTSLFSKHHWEGQAFSSIIRKTDSYITFDTTHYGGTKDSIIDFFSINTKRIKNIHLSDYKNNLLQMHMPLGEGKLPIKNFLLTLRKKKYNGFVTLEINSDYSGLLNSIKLVNKIRNYAD